MSWMFWKSRTSTWAARAEPPWSVISRTTVLIVDCWLFGSGGKGDACEASDTVLPATTTVRGRS